VRASCRRVSMLPDTATVLDAQGRQKAEGHAPSPPWMGKGDEGGGGVFGGFGGMLSALRKRAEKELRADPDSAFSR